MRKQSPKKTRAPSKRAAKPKRTKKAPRIELADTMHTIRALIEQHVGQATGKEELLVLANALFNNASGLAIGAYGFPHDTSAMIVWSHEPFARLIDAARSYAHYLNQPVEGIIQAMLMKMNPNVVEKETELRWN